MTVHYGVAINGATPLALTMNRVTGIALLGLSFSNVKRMTAHWQQIRSTTHFDELCEIMWLVTT